MKLIIVILSQTTLSHPLVLWRVPISLEQSLKVWRKVHDEQIIFSLNNFPFHAFHNEFSPFGTRH